MTTVIVSSAGVQGVAGIGWLNGTGAPSDSIGVDGSFYLDQANPDSPEYWGPKTNGTWTGHGPYTFGTGEGGGVISVTATDDSIVVTGTTDNPTVATGTLDQVAELHPPAASWSNAGFKITDVANGTTSGDVATFGQIPTSLPPNGAAGGDLTGSYPNPTLAGTSNVESIIRANRLDQMATPTAAVSFGGEKLTNLANGTVSTDAAAFGQIPTTLPPSGSAGGDLTGSYPNPTLTGTANVESIIRANRLDQFAAPTSAVPWNSQKITGLANGTASTDAAAFGQIPTALPPNGSAGGDLTGTYPSPTLSATANVESIIRANRLDQFAAPTAAVSWGGEKITNLANGSGAQDAAAFGQIPVVSSATPQPLGNPAAGSTGQTADAGHTHLAYENMPSDQGIIVWNYDPVFAATTWNPTNATNGYLFLSTLWLRSATTLTNIVYGLSSAQASGLVTGENLIGLYNSAGNLVAQTADQTSIWSNSSLQHVNFIPWTSPYSAAAGRYYVCFVYNGVPATGASLNFKGSGGGPSSNAGQTGASMRFGMISGSYTSLPSSVTLSSMVNPSPFNNQWLAFS